MFKGTKHIPGPVEEFHANFVTDTSVGLSWEAPKGFNISNYQVFYELVDQNATVAKPEEKKSVRSVL